MNSLFYKIKGAVFTALCFSTLTFAQSRKPNVLFIMTDQQHAGMMSCAGNRWLKTPNLDQLAAQSVRFTKAYVTNPVCSPSRFSLLTGLYPSAINMRFNGTRISEEKVREILPRSIAFTFKNSGYETYYGGKVHLPGGDAAAYGFENMVSVDERDELAKSSAQFLLGREAEKPFFYFVSFINPHDICYEAIRDHQPESKAAKATPRELLDAIKIPDSVSEERFFARYCPPLPDNFEPTQNEPQAIYDLEQYHPFTIHARKNWTERQWRLHRWAYHRLTEDVDAQIGIVLDALEQSRFRDNTIVVFTSDHGEMSAAHRLEHKTVFYEESSNVPLMISFKGIRNKGRKHSQYLISTGLDIYPTLCDLAGIKAPDALPGISFAPLLKGNAREYRPRKYYFLENELGFMVRDLRYKYALYDNGNEMLIDLENDPGEMVNVVGQPAYSSIRKFYKKHLDTYLASGIKH